MPEDDNLDQVLPAGDLSIFADLGLEGWELCAIAGDLDLFPDEAVASIAGRLSSVRRWNARSKSRSGPDPAR